MSRTGAGAAPMAGDFETPIFEQPCSFAGREFNIRFGNLPDNLNLAVSLIGAQGAVGLELLKRFSFLITPHGALIYRVLTVF